MALPYTLTTSVTMAQFLTYTLGNASYLDSRNKFIATTFDRDISLLTDLSINGIGFSPSSIIFLSVDPTTNAVSWGFYCPLSNTYQNISYGLGYNDGLSSASMCIYLKIDASNIAFGYVYSLNDDGFTLKWLNTGTPTGTATIIALCIR